MIRKYSVPLLLLSFTTFAATGCGESNTGPKRYQVSGSIMLDGKPLKNGELLALPENGGSILSGAEIVNGNYLLPKSQGLSAGSYKVSISSTELKPLPKGVVDPTGETMQVIELVPKRYNQNTELMIEIADGNENVFSFELQSK